MSSTTVMSTPRVRWWGTSRPSDNFVNYETVWNDATTGLFHHHNKNEGVSTLLVAFDSTSSVGYRRPAWDENTALYALGRIEPKELSTAAGRMAELAQALSHVVNHKGYYLLGKAGRSHRGGYFSDIHCMPVESYYRIRSRSFYHKEGWPTLKQVQELTARINALEDLTTIPDAIQAPATSPLQALAATTKQVPMHVADGDYDTLWLGNLDRHNPLGVFYNQARGQIMLGKAHAVEPVRWSYATDRFPKKPWVNGGVVLSFQSHDLQELEEALALLLLRLGKAFEQIQDAGYELHGQDTPGLNSRGRHIRISFSKDGVRHGYVFDKTAHVLRIKDLRKVVKQFESRA
jgi:hypothetical protein